MVRGGDVTRGGAPCVDDALQSPPIDDGDAVTEALELIEIMGGDEHGALGRAQPLNQVAKALRPYRIESVRRLVEKQHLLIAKQRLGEPQALQIALGERLELLVAVLPDSERIDNRLDGLARDGDRQAREHRETLEGPLEGPLRIERDELRQIADAVLLDIRAR